MTKPKQNLISGVTPKDEIKRSTGWYQKKNGDIIWYDSQRNTEHYPISGAIGTGIRGAFGVWKSAVIDSPLRGLNKVLYPLKAVGKPALRYIGEQNIKQAEIQTEQGKFLAESINSTTDTLTKKLLRSYENPDLTIEAAESQGLIKPNTVEVESTAEPNSPEVENSAEYNMILEAEKNLELKEGKPKNRSLNDWLQSDASSSDKQVVNRLLTARQEAGITTPIEI